MKFYKENPSYPLLRREFKNCKALGAVINRSASYVANCLNGRRNFSKTEKSLLLKWLGVEITPGNIAAYFPEDSSK